MPYLAMHVCRTGLVQDPLNSYKWFEYEYSLMTPTKGMMPKVFVRAFAACAWR